MNQRFRRPLDKRAQLRYNASEKAALRRIASAAQTIAAEAGWELPDHWNLLTLSKLELLRSLADYHTRFPGPATRGRASKKALVS